MATFKIAVTGDISPDSLARALRSLSIDVLSVELVGQHEPGVMQEIERILSPDISIPLKVNPSSGERAIKARLSFKEIEELAPLVPVVGLAKDKPAMQRAVEAVLNGIPRGDWARPETERLVHNAQKLLGN